MTEQQFLDYHRSKDGTVVVKNPRWGQQGEPKLVAIDEDCVPFDWYPTEQDTDKQ